MTHIEDRATFERHIFQPPHTARMLETVGRYVGAMNKADKDAFLKLALDAFWAYRADIPPMGIRICWGQALRMAARSRDRWLVWPNGSLTESVWVRGDQLGLAGL